jgi:hypothetical protein
LVLIKEDYFFFFVFGFASGFFAGALAFFFAAMVSPPLVCD